MIKINWLLGVGFLFIDLKDISLCQVYSGMNVEVALDEHFVEWARNISMGPCGFFLGEKCRVYHIRHGIHKIVDFVGVAFHSIHLEVNGLASPLDRLCKALCGLWSDPIHLLDYVFIFK